MKSFLLLVLLAVLSPGYGLKCYQCGGKEEDCTKDKLQGDKDKYLKTCTDIPGQDMVCMRTWTKKDDVTSVTNLCNTKEACEKLKKTCDDADSDDGECAVGCCDTDECNASSAVSLSVILMTACSVFGLALMK